MKILITILLCLAASVAAATTVRVANLTTNSLTLGSMVFPPGVTVVDQASMPAGTVLLGVPVDYSNDLSVFASSAITNVSVMPSPLSQGLAGFTVGLVLAGSAFGLWAVCAGLRLRPPGA